MDLSKLNIYHIIHFHCLVSTAMHQTTQAAVCVAQEHSIPDDCKYSVVLPVYKGKGNTGEWHHLSCCSFLYK